MKWSETSHGMTAEPHGLVRIVVYLDRESVWRWSLLDLETRGWLIEGHAVGDLTKPAEIKKTVLRLAAHVIDVRARKWTKLADSLHAKP